MRNSTSYTYENISSLSSKLIQFYTETIVEATLRD